MIFCPKCGAQLDDNAEFCTKCGASVKQQATGAAGAVNQVLNTPDTTAQFDQQDIQNNKVMAVLAYLGILVLVPIFGAKDSKFAKFHANQGLIVFIIDVALGIIQGIIGAVTARDWATYLLYGPNPVAVIFNIIFGIIWIVVAIFIIMGIVNAATGKAKELPIIGKFKILK